MSMPCINCSFYNEHLNICSLDIEDWDTLKHMGVNLNEEVILDSLYVTDETCIEEECCHSCKFSIYNADLSYYECAPFESARNVCAKSIHFKRKNGEEC